MIKNEPKKYVGDYNVDAVRDAYENRGRWYYFLVKEGLEPVSYTHLDVYKRQICSRQPVLRIIPHSSWWEKSLSMPRPRTCFHIRKRRRQRIISRAVSADEDILKQVFTVIIRRK